MIQSQKIKAEYGKARSSVNLYGGSG